MVSGWIISRARPDERTAALRIAFAHLGEDEQLRRVAHLHDLIAVGEVDPDGLFVARRAGEIRGVFACLPLAGATALVWPPRGEFDGGLIHAGLAWLRERGVKHAQALAPPNEADVLAPLAESGFVSAGPMSLLRHDLTNLPESPPSSRVRLIPFLDIDSVLFGRTLERTYEATLDFPELSNVRTIDEILTTYRGNPLFRPEHWWLASIDGTPAGVLMLTELDRLEGWDLTYVGVVPEQRRHGIGRALVEAALRVVADAGGSHLDVAVDARNRPAIQLYVRLKFQLYDERRVSLIFLTSGA